MMRRIKTIKTPSAPNTALFSAMPRTQTRMRCMTLSTAAATFQARSGRNQITDRMFSIWAAPGEGACACAIGDQGVGRRV